MQNISSFLSVILTLITFVYSKQLTNVFTALNSISKYDGTGDPYSFYTVSLTWALTSSQNAQTGDTFTLVMPGVAEVRLTGGSGYLQHFDLTAEGFVIGSCNIDQSAWAKDYTQLNCQITSSDVSKYSSLTGTVSYIVVFIGGGTPEFTSFANSYTVGKNTISFNDGAGNEISNSVTFSATSYNQYSSDMMSRYTMSGTGWLYIILPKAVCQGQGGIKSAKFSVQINSNSDGIGSIVQSKTGLYSTNSINSFFFPKSYTTLDNSTPVYSQGGTRMDVSNIGSVPDGSSFWMTTQYDMSVYTDADFSVSYDLSNIKCQYGYYSDQYSTETFHLVKASSGGSGSGDGK